MLNTDKLTKSVKSEINDYLIGHWSDAEHNLFLEALFLYGKDSKNIRKYIKTRTREQIKSHSQKYFQKLKRDFFNKIIKCEMGNKEAYMRMWIQELIDKEYIPIIGKYSDLPDYQSNLNRLFQTIWNNKEKQEIIISHNNIQTIPCNCNYGNKSSCDCETACCYNNSNYGEDYHIYKSIYRKTPIFRIEKIYKNHVRKKNKIEHNFFKENNGNYSEFPKENNFKENDILLNKVIQSQNQNNKNNINFHFPFTDTNSSIGVKSVFNLNFLIGKTNSPEDNFQIENDDYNKYEFETEYFFKDNNFLK